MLTGTASYEALEEELIFTCSENKERAAYLAKFPFLPFITIIFNQLSVGLVLSTPLQSYSTRFLPTIRT